MSLHQEIPKLCMLCGAGGHIQGPECPSCCSICGGDKDADGNCLEFDCNKTVAKCPVNCDHKWNPKCAFSRYDPTEISNGVPTAIEMLE